jgi:hypothetical protein
VRLPRMRYGGLFFLNLKPKALTFQAVKDRFGEGALRMGTTHTHDRSVYYVYAEHGAELRFVLQGPNSESVTNVAIDRYRSIRASQEEPRDFDSCEPSAAASTNAKDKVSGQLIKTAEFTGVLFPSATKAFLHTVDQKLAEYAYPWDPSQNDIVAAEKAVRLYLDQRAPQIVKKLIQYRRQYSGIAIHRNRLIHMNFFCDDMGRDWTSEEVTVDDGGDCYFQVNYSVSHGKVVDFTVNGES